MPKSPSVKHRRLPKGDALSTTFGDRGGTQNGGAYRAVGRQRFRYRPRDEARMTLVEHLEELRSRVLKAAVAFVAVPVGAAFFVEDIFRWLLAPSGLDGLAFFGPAQGLLTHGPRYDQRGGRG